MDKLSDMNAVSQDLFLQTLNLNPGLCNDNNGQIKLNCIQINTPAEESVALISGCSCMCEGKRFSIDNTVDCRPKSRSL